MYLNDVYAQGTYLWVINIKTSKAALFQILSQLVTWLLPHCSTTKTKATLKLF